MLSLCFAVPNEDTNLTAVDLSSSIYAPLLGATPSSRPTPMARSDFNPRTPCGVRQRKCTKFSAHFAITDNSIGFPRPECRLLGHFLLIPGACSARERVRTFL